MLTIVLLVHNREKFLKKAIHGILAQTDKRFFFIIVDNGSVDKSSAICLDMIKGYYSSKYVKLAKAGHAGDSYVEAIKQCETDYVLVTHDDDHLKKNYVKMFYRIIKRHPKLGALGGNARLIDSNNKIIQPRLYGKKNVSKNLFIKKKNYINLYQEMKLWIPTPSIILLKKAYLDYYPKLKPSFNGLS